MTPEEIKRILHERAVKLAQSQAEQSSEETMDLLEFQLAEETYAIENHYVREVHPLRDLTPLPCAPSFLAGIVSLRGRILPVFNFKRFFDLPEKGLPDLHRLICVSGHGMEIAFLCDTIKGVRAVPTASMHPPLPTLEGIQSVYLKGITADRLIVLDLDRVLSDPKIIIHEEVET